jgi:hypothetical protein
VVQAASTRRRWRPLLQVAWRRLVVVSLALRWQARRRWERMVMPLLHYIGVPLLSAWVAQAGDFHPPPPSPFQLQQHRGHDEWPGRKPCSAVMLNTVTPLGWRHVCGLWSISSRVPQSSLQTASDYIELWGTPPLRAALGARHSPTAAPKLVFSLKYFFAFSFQ